MPGQDRVIATVVFTDIVDSTAIAKELGDARWKELLRRHHELIRRALRQHGGREVDTAGDGFFVLFQRPIAALEFARDAVDGVRSLGIEIRAGAHVGEIEQDGRLARGVAVHIGSRVMGAAGPGEILVSQTLRDLIEGSTPRLEDRGTQTLKGVPEPVRLFALIEVDGSPLPPTLPAEEAARRREGIAASAPTTRRFVGVGIAAAAAVIAAVVLIVVTRNNPTTGTSSVGSTGVPGNAVVRLDPVSGEVTTVFEPLAPAFDPVIAVGEGGLWIRDRLVRHIDLDTSDVIGDRDVQPSLFTSPIAVGGHRVWTCGHPNRLVALNPSDEDFVGGLDPEMAGGLDPHWACGSLAAGDRWVWVVGQDGALLRVDAVTFDDKRRPDVVGSPGGVTSGLGAVWIGDKLGGSVEVYDFHLQKVKAVDLGGGSPEAVVLAGGYVWVLNRGSGTLQRIDPVSYDVESYSIGEDPVGLAAGSGSIWVADQSGVVIRVDPETRSQKEFTIGRPVDSIAVDPESGFVYVTTTRRTDNFF